MADAVHDLWIHRQRELNAWTDRWLKGITHLRIDGDPGHATYARTMGVKFYLGYGNNRDGEFTGAFVRRMRHPLNEDYFPPGMIHTGRERRATQKSHWRANQISSYLTAGVTRFDGRPVAKCAVPYLVYARSHGWFGQLVSGWRDPNYSQHLCYNMCGHPSCPGLCAGLSSNHVGSSCARFAVDVSDYIRFGHIMATMSLAPGQPRLHNFLPHDLVHYSPSGN